jgi:hypothetical protein
MLSVVMLSGEYGYAECFGAKCRYS